MNFISNPVNDSPLLSKKAGASLGDVRGLAVKFDENGLIAIAGAGEEALGVAILSNSETIEKGDDVDVQIRGFGIVKAGAAINIGDKLTPDTNGAFVPASSGSSVGIAMETADANGAFIQMLIRC